MYPRSEMTNATLGGLLLGPLFCSGLGSFPPLIPSFPCGHKLSCCLYSRYRSAMEWLITLRLANSLNTSFFLARCKVTSAGGQTQVAQKGIHHNIPPSVPLVRRCAGSVRRKSTDPTLVTLATKNRSCRSCGSHTIT